MILKIEYGVGYFYVELGRIFSDEAKPTIG